MGNKLCAPLLKKNYNENDYPWHVRKDSHLLRLWAEVFRVHGDGEYMRWQRVSDDVVPVNISCVEDNPRTVFHITAYNRHVEKIFDVRITQPDTIICPATESFVHWRDTANNCEWGLNFTSPIDARRFRECCSYPTQKFARKATSASSLRLSPPKRVHGKASSVSSPSSPVNTNRRSECEQACHASLDTSLAEIPHSTFQQADSEIVTIRKEKSATIPRSQFEQGPQTFKPQSILKPSSDILVADSVNNKTVLRNTNSDGRNSTVRKSLPPSVNSHTCYESVDSRQNTEEKDRRTKQPLGSGNRVSFSSFGKEPEIPESSMRNPCVSDKSQPVQKTISDKSQSIHGPRVIDKSQSIQSPRVSDKIQLETAFVGEVTRPEKRVSVKEPTHGKVKKQVLRVLAPPSQKSQTNSTRKSSSSSSPEWPSPPEPLTPLTPVTPVCNMDFDSDALKKMLQSLPLSPTEREEKNERDQGFHDDPRLSEFSSNSKNGTKTSGTKNAISHDKMKVDSKQVEQRKGVTNKTATTGKTETKTLNQCVESELYLRNKGMRDNYCRDSYPDSGIGGMTIDTADSVWSAESSKSAPARTAIAETKPKTSPPSAVDAHSSPSSPDSFHSDQAQVVDCSDSKQYLTADISDEDGEASDSSLHTMTEADSQIYTQQYGAIRKAGWLVVKNWLVHKKKKLELASKRNWKRYWVCLKGSLLLFNEHNEEQQESSPRHILVLEGAIAQAVPEHPKRDNIFSLSTALGDGYLLQAQSQTDVESWILSIHSACASTLARQHAKDNTLKLLRTELQKLEANIDMDVKMKKMAELQLTVVRDPRSRQAISKQICQWEENLEKLYIEQYRFRCYLSSLQGTELPNPKVLLANASKTTKTTLGRLGIFTVTSFHALVCARKPVILPAFNGKGHQKPGLISPQKYVNRSPVNPSTEEASSVVDQVKELCQEAAECAGSSMKASGSNESSPAGSLSRIGLPSNQKTLVGVDKRTTVQQLLESVCNKRQLNPEDHYVRVKLPDTPPGVYAVPDRNLIIKQIPYETIDVCQKSIFQIELTKTETDKDYGMTLEAELGDDLEREDDLKIYISDVRKGGLSDTKGLIIGDEILVINRRIVHELDMASIEVLIQQTQALLLTIRSLRQRRPPSSFITEHTDKLIEGMTCPPPPSQSRLSEQQLGQLMVPNPAANSEKRHKLLTSPKHSLLQKKMNDAEIEDLMKSADQVTAICRATKDVNAHTPSDCSSICTASLSDAQKLRKVIMELIDTERAYVKDLTCLTERYLEPLKEETFLTSDEIEQLFGNIQEIVQFQRQFLLSLEEGIQLESDFFTTEDPVLFRRVLFSLGGSFLYYANHFKVYSSFCASHSRSQKILNPESSNIQHANESLKKFLLARNPKQQHSSTLESYLIKPIQRILKYPLLLNQLCNLTNPDTDEHYHLSEALKGMEAVAEHINEMQKIYEEYGSVFDDLSKMYKDFYTHKKPVDLSVGDLQMYGTVEWCNMCDLLGKIKKGTELENIVFVFKTGVVFLCRERLKRKKVKGSGSKACNQELTETVERFRTLIPVQDVQVRGGRVNDMDGHYWWELIHSRSDKEGRPERLYQFCNSTLDSKSDFMRIIRQTIRDSVRRMTLPPGNQTAKPNILTAGIDK